MVFCIHQVLEILTDKPKGTGEIAEKLGCHYHTAYMRLRQFLKEGKIEGKKIRNNQQGVWMWWKKKEGNNET